MTPTDEQIAKLPKWAQAYITEITSERDKLRGLPESPTPIEPDLPPPTYESKVRLTRGWSINLYSTMDSMSGLCNAVRKGCSSSVHHGDSWKETRSQGTSTLYSTEKLAWQALRAEFIRWAASQVSKIDTFITKSSDKPAPPQP